MKRINKVGIGMVYLSYNKNIN